MPRCNVFVDNQAGSGSSVAEFFDGLSAEDYPVLSLSADDMTNGDEWNFMPLVQSAIGLDTPGVIASVQPALLHQSSGATTSTAVSADNVPKSVQHVQG